MAVVGGRAGVPLVEPVAGVAMGLILEPDGKFVILTDILGSEDALGDMDFKVAGTASGVTAFQMDIKVSFRSKAGWLDALVVTPLVHSSRNFFVHLMYLA